MGTKQALSLLGVSAFQKNGARGACLNPSFGEQGERIARKAQVFSVIL
jgi:hypothetical protein